MKSELLAPAGDIEAGYAALFYGADALYLGLRQFSARATAPNFSPDELCQITGYAHSLKRKIYVTVNTLVQNAELENLIQTLDACQKANVDGLIIQDLGVARIVQESYPDLEMHASTQMAVHNKEGALFLKKMGFKRIVLARELDLNEIKEIASIPHLETESFIHGALCYAYSGLCQFSSMESGMSANRGKCLYPCRACFGGDLGSKHLFSMKDMALEEDVLKLPVTSLKIEGRKKSALYVAAVVNYYRKVLDKKPVENLADDIKQIFARPWTKFCINGKNKNVIDTDFVGHRGLNIGTVGSVIKGVLTFKTSAPIARFDGIQIDVKEQEKPFGFSLEKMRVRGKNVFEAAANDTVEVVLPPQSPFIEKGNPVYLASSSRVKGAYHYTRPKENEFKYRMPVDVQVVIEPNKITATALGKMAEHVECFEKANNTSKVAQAVQQAFNKTGDTDLSLAHLGIDNPNALFVPASVLNELRRDLYAQIEVVISKGNLPALSLPTKTQKAPEWIIKTDTPETLKSLDTDTLAEVIILLNPKMDLSALAFLPKNKIRLALPTVARNVELYRPLIVAALNAGYKKWEVGNYWALELLPSKGIDLSFDNTIYMLNEQAVAFAAKMGATRVTLSTEDTQDNLKSQALKSILPTALVVYQDVPLFISANCIRPNTCKECKGGTLRYSLIKDGNTYEAVCPPCQTIVLNKKAFCLGAEASEVAANYYRIDFVNRPYTGEEAQKITSLLMQGKAVPNTYTGNWKRRI